VCEVISLSSPPGKTRYPLYRRLGGPQGWSGRAENLVPTGIWSRTVQPIVSLYSDWATWPTAWLYEPTKSLGMTVVDIGYNRTSVDCGAWKCSLIQRTWCFVDIIHVILINLWGTDIDRSVRTVSSKKKKLDVIELQNSDEEFEVSFYIFNLGYTRLCCRWQSGCHGVSHIWRCNAAIVVCFHTLQFSKLHLWNVCTILK